MQSTLSINQYVVSIGTEALGVMKVCKNVEPGKYRDNWPSFKGMCAYGHVSEWSVLVIMLFSYAVVGK